MPSESRVGQPDTVIVHTFGPGPGCVKPSHTRVEVRELTATIEPYDWDGRLNREPGDFFVCNQAALTFRHEAVVTFQRTGDAKIMIVGWMAEDSVVTVRRDAVVR